MVFKKSITGLVLSFALSPAWIAFPAAAAEVLIGTQIGDLTFKDQWFVSRTLSEFKDAKAYVLVFTTTDCPMTQRVLPKLNELAEAYRDKGVQFLSLNVSPKDDILDVSHHALEYRLRFPSAKDADAKCAAAVGATRTPEIIVLDADRVIRYRGRVNDQVRLSGVQPQPSREDLQLALEDVLAGRKVAVAETPADGCAIPEQRLPAIDGEEPDYARHIAPLMQQHCTECHRPNTAAPFSLLNYEQVARKAKTIVEVVEEGRMPPWFAHPDFGAFKNDRRMSDADRRTLLRWARGEKRSGDLSTLPAAPDLPTERWSIGTPDLIVTDDEVQEIPATGFIKYRYLVLPYKFEHDTWIQQLEILPSNPAVMHHAIVVAQAPGEKWPAPPGKSKYLHGIVPGGDPLELTDGLGLMIPAGWELALEMHYVTTGKPETDQVSIGIRYARETIRKELKWFPVENRGIKIPPGEASYAASATLPIDRDITLIEALVHMHLRGKDATIRALHADGREATILRIPNYSFDWQQTYRFAPSIAAMGPGSRLVFDYHYDNSTFNPYNPDPSKEVTWGDQTFQEMFTCFLFFTEDKEKLNIPVDPKTGRAMEVQ